MLNMRLVNGKWKCRTRKNANILICFHFVCLLLFLRSMTVILDDGMNELENWVLAMKTWFMHHFLHLYKKKLNWKCIQLGSKNRNNSPKKLPRNYNDWVYCFLIGLSTYLSLFLVFVIIKASDVKHNPLNLQLTTKKEKHTHTLAHTSFFAIHFSEF